MLLKVIVDFRKMLLDEKTYDIGVFIKSWQIFLENVSEFTLFNKFNKKPESQACIAVHKQLPNNEIHSLNIIDLSVVTCESP